MTTQRWAWLRSTLTLRQPEPADQDRPTPIHSAGDAPPAATPVAAPNGPDETE